MSDAIATLTSALAHYQADDLPRAESACRDVLRHEPRNIDALRLLGVLSRKAKRFDESIGTLRQALSLANARRLRKTAADGKTSQDLAVLWFELATGLRESGQVDDALAGFRKALELWPDFQEACVNLGGLLETQERFDEARPWLERSVRLKPTCGIAHYNLGNVYRGLADIDRATACFEQAAALDPSYAKAHWNLSMCLLLKGDFARGWQEYEWRQRCGEVAIDAYPYPQWDGSPIDDKTILVHAEQGVGDEVLFASCLPELIERCGQCIIVCEPRLANLFGRSFPEARAYGYPRRVDWAPASLPEQIDLQIPAGSVPLYLRQSLDQFPERDRFLYPDPAPQAQWRSRYDALGPGLKIGISWRAGGKSSERRRRTTGLDAWQGIFSVPDVQFINLQYGDSTEELADARKRLGVTIHDWPEGDPLVDLDGFAAKLSALDLVISVGNATVHMAGALGVPAWTIVPQVPAWRWLVAGETTPWYKSVRMIRQTKRGEWDDVFARLETMLREKSGHTVSSTRKQTPANSNSQIPNPKSANQSLLATLSVPDALDVGLKHHQAGQFDQAEAIYREIIDHAPRYTNALQLLGVLAQQTGRAELAIRTLRRAISVHEPSAMVHFNLGRALQDAEQLDEAAASYRRAMQLNPRFVEPMLNLGVILEQQGRAQEAASILSAAVSIQPDNADLHLNLGHSLRTLCCPDEAICSYEEALRLRPNFAQAHAALGAALLDDARVEEAVARLERAVELHPNYATAHNNLANALRRLGRLNEAATHFAQAIHLNPASFEAAANLADLKHAQGDTTEAARLYRQALKIQPRHAPLLNNLGMVLQEQGHAGEALEHYEAALQLDPNYAMAHSNRALLLLQLGRFAEGWAEYEWRWHCGDGPRPRNYFSEPLWDGGPLRGKTILVHGEQGIGDEIMFATCLPEVIETAAHCVIACQPRLVKLFARSFPGATIHGVTRGMEHAWRVPAEPHIDVQIPSGSLPLHLRDSLRSFPRRQRLLTPDAAKVAAWRARLSGLGNGLKVGISWRGGKKAQDERQRWTTLADWRAVLRMPRISLINLQYGDCRDEIATARQEFGTEIYSWPDADPLGDLDDFAAQVAALDLVISVGNATVHLAGALGVPAWSLLPCHGGWRWLKGRDDTPWYASVRLFRQSRPGRWDEAFERVAAELLRLTLTREAS